MKQPIRFSTPVLQTGVALSAAGLAGWVLFVAAAFAGLEQAATAVFIIIFVLSAVLFAGAVYSWINRSRGTESDSRFLRPISLRRLVQQLPLWYRLVQHTAGILYVAGIAVATILMFQRGSEWLLLVFLIFPFYAFVLCITVFWSEIRLRQQAPEVVP